MVESYKVQLATRISKYWEIQQGALQIWFRKLIHDINISVAGIFLTKISNFWEKC